VANDCSRKRRWTDSPWFWAYLFGTAALIALAIIGPKYQSRQAQIEGQFEGRQQGRAKGSNQSSAQDAQLPMPNRIGLEPLVAAVAILTIVAWLVWWWTRSNRQDIAQHDVAVENRRPSA